MQNEYCQYKFTRSGENKVTVSKLLIWVKLPSPNLELIIIIKNRN